MKKVTDYTIQELLDAGAKVDIYFHHCENLQEAHKKIKPLNIGELETDHLDGGKRVLANVKKSNGVSVAAFYNGGY